MDLFGQGVPTPMGPTVYQSLKRFGVLHLKDFPYKKIVSQLYFMYQKINLQKIYTMDQDSDRYVVSCLCRRCSKWSLSILKVWHIICNTLYVVTRIYTF